MSDSVFTPAEMEAQASAAAPSAFQAMLDHRIDLGQATSPMQRLAQGAMRLGKSAWEDPVGVASAFGQGIAHTVGTARDAWTGDLPTQPGLIGEEAVERALDMAGMAMTGGLGGAPAAVGETVLGAGPRRLTYASPLRHGNTTRYTRAEVEREIPYRMEQVEEYRATHPDRVAQFEAEVQALREFLPRFDEPVAARSTRQAVPDAEAGPRPPNPAWFKPRPEIDVGDGFVVRRGAELDDDMRRYNVFRRAEDGSLARRPSGYADMMRHEDGRWETQMLHVNPRSRGKGAATALYRGVEQDTGQPRLPSGTLLSDGHAFWSKRAPDAVAHYKPVGNGEVYFSPTKLKGYAENPMLNESTRAMYRAMYDSLPPEALTPEQLAKHFAAGGWVA